MPCGLPCTVRSGRRPRLPYNDQENVDDDQHYEHPVYNSVMKRVLQRFSPRMRMRVNDWPFVELVHAQGPDRFRLKAGNGPTSLP